MSSGLSRKSADKLAEEINNRLFDPTYGKLLDAVSCTISKGENALRQLKRIRSKMQEHHKHVRIARGAGATVGVLAASVVIGSLVAAPFTGGLSLFGTLAIAGISGSVAAAGTVTNVGASGVGKILSETLLSDASCALEKYEAAEKRLRTLYRLFETECTAIYWDCPEIRSYFSQSDFVKVALLACTRGDAFLKFSGIYKCGTKTLRSGVGTVLCGSGGGIIVLGVMAKTVQELSARAYSCSVRGFSIVTSLSTIGLTAVAVCGVIAVVVTLSLNVYTLVQLFNNKPSEAVQKVRAAEVQLQQRKDQLENLLEEIKTAEWINKHRW